MNSIRNRILSVVLLAVALPLLIILLATQTVLQSTFFSIEKSNLQGISEEMGRNVSLMMERISNDLNALSTNPVLETDSNDHSAVVKEMERQVKHYKRFADITLYDRNALLVCSTDPELEPTYRDYSPVVERVLKGETVIHKPARKPGAEGLYVKVYLPLRTGANEVSGFLKARVSFDHVATYIAGMKIGKEGQAVLLDGWGNLIAHRSDEKLLTKFDEAGYHISAISGRTGIYEDSLGEDQMFSAVSLDESRTLVGGRWTLVCQKPMAEVALPVRRARNILIAVVTMSGLFACILSGLLSRNISTSVVSANNAALLVASGDMKARMEEDGPQELRSLASAFNLMVRELQEHRSKLEHLVQLRTASLQHSQQRLSNAMAQLQSAFDSTQEAILLVNNNGRVIATNGLFCSIFGFDEEQVAKEHLTEILMQMQGACVEGDEFKDTWSQVLEDRSAKVELEYQIKTPEARSLTLYSAPVIADDGQVSGRLWTWRDFTKQRTLEESLRQSQKMEAVGQLAGGVAHDFNNLLTAIVGNLALVEMELQGEEHKASRMHVEMAVKAGGRAAELIKQLLGFSRRSHLKLQAAQANAVIEDVCGLLTSTFDPKIKIVAEPDPSAWPVLVDSNQLEQVIMNLCVNAKDAMDGSGTIRMRSCNRTVTESDLSMHADARTGDFVCITVEDNGSGMSAEVQAKIFEPFFTTKEQGKGTGLGLATSFGIIKQLGGWIVCRSEIGVGTRFDLFLPKSKKEIVVQEVVQSEALSASAKNRTKTLLLVDDEEIVRRVAEALLTKLGYRILVAGDGEEALEIYSKRGDEIDLVMLDMTMPTMSGQDAFRILRERYDYVPVLICSGYLLDLTAFEEETGARPDGFVQKPYNMETMARTVEELIDNSRAAA